MKVIMNHFKIIEEMRDRGWKNTDLAKASKISARTADNIVKYPGRKFSEKSGKAIAKGLGIRDKYEIFLPAISTKVISIKDEK